MHSILSPGTRCLHGEEEDRMLFSYPRSTPSAAFLLPEEFPVPCPDSQKSHRAAPFQPHLIPDFRIQTSCTPESHHQNAAHGSFHPRRPSSLFPPVCHTRRIHSRRLQQAMLPYAAESAHTAYPLPSHNRRKYPWQFSIPYPSAVSAGPAYGFPNAYCKPHRRSHPVCRLSLYRTHRNT